MTAKSAAIVLAIVGFFIGLFIAESFGYYVLSAIAGAVLGIVFARLAHLERRINQLESTRQKPQPEPASAWGRPSATETGSEPGPVARPASPWHETASGTATLHDSAPSGEAILRQSRDDELKAEQGTDAELTESPRVTGPSLLQIFIGKATEWFSSGNVPVKVGVIISFIGVAFLLKYAVDRRLLVISLEFRLLAVAAAGVALLLIGWRLRHKKRVYALSLQGGGIGILFLTIFAALRIWQLLPAPTSFVLLVALTVCTGALAVLQNSRSLAIIGVVGGFLAPILTSTGQGSHVVLFSYYLVLNIAILGIAWFRAWRELNLIGWLFTFIIGSLWGFQYYKPELLSSTQPFLLLHFLFYQAIAILFALRQPPNRLGYVDVALVFGTPLVGFALQAALVHGIEYALAYSAVILAAFYALTAFWLWRSQGQKLRLLIESYTALAVGFATIAIPLAVDARWTSAAWAVEGAALVWVGVRQGRPLARLAGTALIGLSGLAFLDDGWQDGAGMPLLNGNVLGGLLISISALFASRRLEVKDESFFGPAFKLASILLFAWGALWWLATGWMEINDRMPYLDSSGQQFSYHVALLFLSLSVAAAAWLGSQRSWQKMRQATLIYPFLLIPAALVYRGDGGHLLFNLGWLNWPLASVVVVYMLRVLDEYKEKLAGQWHFGSLLLLTALVALETSWWTELISSRAWGLAVALSIPGLAAMLVRRFSQWPAWPVPAHPQIYHAAGIFLVSIQVALLTLLMVADPGNPAPLPYIPVLNPFDLAMLFAMLTAARILLFWQTSAATAGRRSPDEFLAPEKALLAAAFFIMTTSALVRGVHHYTGVAWDGDDLFDSVIVQTSLSVYWGLLGFSGMIWGARKSRRLLWMTGVAFMALVVIKLFVVDLGNSGTIARIISFIAIGGLLLVVGYFAPAPPRKNPPD
jgi:uncharacterized membrane protein